MRCPREPRCFSRDNSFFIHQCDVERANVVPVDVTNITDLKINQWTAVEVAQPCWFEDMGNALIDNEQLGRVPIARFNVWMPGDTDVRPGDRLKKDGLYYLVENVNNFAQEGFHVSCMVRNLTYAQS